MSKISFGSKKIGWCVLLVNFVVLSSHCTFQKRVYRKGYYVERITHSKVNNENKLVQTKENFELPIKSVCTPISKNADVNIVVSNSKFPYGQSNVKRYVLKDTCGDKLILKTGDEFVVKVIEVNDKEIKYKRCDNLEGPIYTISASKVYLIEYANGVKEHIVTDSSEQVGNSNDGTQKSSTTSPTKKHSDSYWLAWLLFISGFFFYLSFILWPFAMTQARKARREIAQNSNYKGRAEMGLIMYITFIFLSITALGLITLGGIFLVYASTYAPYSTGWAVSVLFGPIFLIIGLLYAFLIWRFITTSRSGDF